MGMRDKKANTNNFGYTCNRFVGPVYWTLLVTNKTVQWKPLLKIAIALLCLLTLPVWRLQRVASQYFAGPPKAKRKRLTSQQSTPKQSYGSIDANSTPPTTTMRYLVRHRHQPQGGIINSANTHNNDSMRKIRNKKCLRCQDFFGCLRVDFKKEAAQSSETLIVKNQVILQIASFALFKNCRGKVTDVGNFLRIQSAIVTRFRFRVSKEYCFAVA